MRVFIACVAAAVTTCVFSVVAVAVVLIQHIFAVAAAIALLYVVVAATKLAASGVRQRRAISRTWSVQPYPITADAAEPFGLAGGYAQLPDLGLLGAVPTMSSAVVRRPARPGLPVRAEWGQR